MLTRMILMLRVGVAIGALAVATALSALSLDQRFVLYCDRFEESHAEGPHAKPLSCGLGAKVSAL